MNQPMRGIVSRLSWFEAERMEQDLTAAYEGATDYHMARLGLIAVDRMLPHFELFGKVTRRHSDERRAGYRVLAYPWTPAKCMPG